MNEYRKLYRAKRWSTRKGFIGGTIFGLILGFGSLVIGLLAGITSALIKKPSTQQHTHPIDFDKIIIRDNEAETSPEREKEQVQ